MSVGQGRAQPSTEVPMAISIRVRVEDAGGSTTISCSKPFVRIGRDSLCDISLTDPSVVGVHAGIEVEHGQIFAVALDEGVTVNGHRVRRGRLFPGDVLRVGQSHSKITFLSAEPVVGAQPTRVEHREESTRCIEREQDFRHGLAWCGKEIGNAEPFVTDVHRLVRDTHRGAPPRVCPDCAAAFTAALLALSAPRTRAA